ncbi:MAG: hypothetical protein R3C01_16405 [Planctomycetaceae bacterium]
MRSLGQFTDIRHVAIFRDYLEAIDIPCRLDEYQGKAQLWVFDEDDLPRAHKELVEFLAHPETAKYQNSAEIAAKKRNLELAATLKEHRALSRRGASSIQKDFGRIWRSMPLTVILIALCVVVTIITSFGFDRVLTNHFRISQILAHNQVWTYPLKEVVFDWEVWRLFTPVFIRQVLCIC